MDDQIPELPSLLDSAPPPEERPVTIKLIGIGGAGGNAIDRLKFAQLERLQLAVIDTDGQVLSGSPTTEKLLIGRGVTRGLSAGGDPELGRLAAESEREAITAMVRNCQLVVIVAGMGRGTGSGAAPVVAEIASKCGALVIAFAPLPFSFEGPARGKKAEEALVALRAAADAVVPLPNDMLMQDEETETGMLVSFARGDEWIDRAVRSLWGMLHRPGLINLDFASLREAFTFRGGKTLYGLGVGEGDDAVNAALDSFLDCPLLHTPENARKADRLLVNITGGTDLSLSAVQHIMSVITEKFGREPHVALGAVVDESWQRRMEIVVIGTTDLNGRGTRRMPDRAARSREAARRAAAAGATTTTASDSGVPLLDLAVDVLPVGTPTTRTRGGTVSSPSSAHASTTATLPAAAAAAPKLARWPAKQDEFSFADEESRGAFDEGQRTIFEGEDLDIPTYRRRGIKLAT